MVTAARKGAIIDDEAAELRGGFAEVTFAPRQPGETHWITSFITFRAGALPAAFAKATCGEAILAVPDAALRGVSATALAVALAAEPLSEGTSEVSLTSALHVGKGVVGNPRESACVAMALAALSFPLSFGAAYSAHVATELPDNPEVLKFIFKLDDYKADLILGSRS